jgi:transcriptional regulator with XRE-family HTH domain
MDYESFVPERITQLRQTKGVSAREMSLSIGQNMNYINHIENRKTEPSLTVFYYICDFFGITPREFFDDGNRQPARLNELMENVKQLDENELLHLAGFIKAIADNKQKVRKA